MKTQPKFELTLAEIERGRASQQRDVDSRESRRMNPIGVRHHRWKS